MKTVCLLSMLISSECRFGYAYPEYGACCSITFSRYKKGVIAGLVLNVIFVSGIIGHFIQVYVCVAMSRNKGLGLSGKQEKKQKQMNA